MDSRVSKQQLEIIRDKLGEKDKSILEIIRKYRYMTTRQINRLYFENSSSSQNAAQRATNRALTKLKEQKLIFTLDRRIGGVRAGSSSYVWALNSPGHRLLSLDDDHSIKSFTRKRIFEPSIRFLEHTLAVSETYVQLVLIAGENESIEIIKNETEPDCWRRYINNSGIITSLKPDLYAETISGEYQDHWFFEIDLSTEAPSRIMNKCEQYYRYYLSGNEQRKNGIFPMVVWITLNTKRTATLRHHIEEEFTVKGKDIFIVIEPNQLNGLIREGPKFINTNGFNSF